MPIKKISAKNRGNCKGCIFYHPEKPKHVLGMGMNRRYCSNGAADAPEACFTNKTIYIETAN